VKLALRQAQDLRLDLIVEMFGGSGTSRLSCSSHSGRALLPGML